MHPPTAPSSPTPAAPGGLPLIGHVHRLARDPLPFITSLREHGSVVRIRIGPTPAYVVTDPALTRRVLVTEAADFAKGGKIIDALRVFFGDGLATVADGDAHLRQRRLMQPMFNKAHIATRGPAMIDQVRAMVTSWPEESRRDVFADMNDVALAVFLVALFGDGLPAHLQGEFTALMPEIMKGTIRQTVLPSWLTRLPLPAHQAHAERVRRLRELAAGSAARVATTFATAQNAPVASAVRNRAASSSPKLSPTAAITCHPRPTGDLTSGPQAARPHPRWSRAR
ncbi:cytochrome P450 [Streptomyces sp. wa22]|uniref:cytochrome P450 n=1 Tax=Streptomyces sp. wa22 TaxID=1828244 RepID=UPI0011C78FD8|nr:cytochrome P450 [Streptomyces sp. wa22]TXS15132.1 cytochrome P450 [Streptomyces sp. wa22]